LSLLAGLAADVEEMMMVVPINPEVNEAEQIRGKKRGKEKGVRSKH
jgi:hypothetical protein